MGADEGNGAGTTSLARSQSMIQIEAGQAIGPYRVQGFLGRGGFAQVFLAQDPRGHRVALKLGDESGGGRYVPRFGEVTSEKDPGRISPDEAPAEALFLNPQDGARAEVLDTREVDQLLRAEVQVLSAAATDGLVRLLDVLEKDGRPVLALEFVPGWTLRERIRALRGVKLRWFVAAARTLERLARKGDAGCHGDVKPENVLVTEDERVVLVDPAPPTGRTDLIVATPPYNPFLRRDSKGDAQALAIVLYEILCGAVPFDHAPWELAGRDLGALPEEERRLSLAYFLGHPRARELNPRTPPELERVIYRAFNDERYGMTELRLDLEDFLLRR